MSEPVEQVHHLAKCHIPELDKLTTHLEAIYGRNNFTVENGKASVTVKTMSKEPENLLGKLKEKSAEGSASELAAEGCKPA